MLTPQLQNVKRQIEEKSEYTRTEKEKKLLEELKFLDSILKLEKLSITESEVANRILKSTAGPPGRCPCCGR